MYKIQYEYVQRVSAFALRNVRNGVGACRTPSLISPQTIPVSESGKETTAPPRNFFTLPFISHTDKCSCSVFVQELYQKSSFQRGFKVLFATVVFLFFCLSNSRTTTGSLLRSLEPVKPLHPMTFGKTSDEVGVFTFVSLSAESSPLIPPGSLETRYGKHVLQFTSKICDYAHDIKNNQADITRTRKFSSRSCFARAFKSALVSSSIPIFS